VGVGDGAEESNKPARSSAEFPVTEFDGPSSRSMSDNPVLSVDVEPTVVSIDATAARSPLWKASKRATTVLIWSFASKKAPISGRVSVHGYNNRKSTRAYLKIQGRLTPRLRPISGVGGGLI